MTVTEDGVSTVVLETAAPPAGLGWRPDGTLLIASTSDRRLLAVDGSATTEVADLAPFEPFSINDMTVDAAGRAYIGCWGFDINRGAPPAFANIVVVEGDGSARVAAAEMRFPNGMVITPDGRTLVAAETSGRALTAFDVDDDGSLSRRRAWAKLDFFPDGICLDADGSIWAASPVTRECVLVAEGGAVRRRIAVEGKGVYACMLGGADRRTLFLCTAIGSPADISDGRTVGFIETVRVETPGAGLP